MSPESRNRLPVPQSKTNPVTPPEPSEHEPVIESANEPIVEAVPVMQEQAGEYLAWLEEAAKVVRTSRRSTYGHPLLNFSRIASLANTYLEGRFKEGQYLTPIDIVYLNILTKVAREKQIHKDDNVVDIIGYAATHNAIDNRMRELGYTNGSSALQTMSREEFNALLVRLENES